MRQQQINEERRCGLTGEGWHKSADSHLKWCLGVGPEAWKAEAQRRNKLLEGCERR